MYIERKKLKPFLWTSLNGNNWTWQRNMINHILRLKFHVHEYASANVAIDILLLIKKSF